MAGQAELLNLSERVGKLGMGLNQNRSHAKHQPRGVAPEGIAFAVIEDIRQYVSQGIRRHAADRVEWAVCGANQLITLDAIELQWQCTLPIEHQKSAQVMLNPLFGQWSNHT
ncbi:hypothetical protein D9M68_620950 [compost metagenome]